MAEGEMSAVLFFFLLGYVAGMIVGIFIGATLTRDD